MTSNNKNEENIVKIQRCEYFFCFFLGDVRKKVFYNFLFFTQIMKFYFLDVILKCNTFITLKIIKLIYLVFKIVEFISK